MIGNLQILRAIAALGVVLYHTDYRFTADVHTDLLGVATFFVISGFLMCFITMHEADGFFTKRIVRIVPLYWVCTGIVLAVAHRHDLESAWIQFVKSLFFVPSEHYPMLGVGWTLNFEIYFYVIFAVALRISRPFAPLVSSAVLLAVLAANEIAPDVFLIRYYSHDYVTFFVPGVVVFYLWRACNGYVPRFPAIILGICTILGAYAVLLMTPSPGRILHCALPPVIVGAALLMAGSRADVAWRPLILIGDSSYALYLTHTIVMDVISSRFVSPGFAALAKSNFAAMLTLVGLCVACGVFVHLFVEKPVLRRLRNLIRRRPGAVLSERSAEAYSRLLPSAAVKPE